MKRKSIIILVLLLFTCNHTAFSQFKEAELKAVYLERIVRFIKWPSEMNNQKPDLFFSLGVLGDNAFGKKLQALYRSRKMRGRSIQVLLLTELENIDKCHALFIAKSKSEQLRQILSITKNSGICFTTKMIILQALIKTGR